MYKIKSLFILFLVLTFVLGLQSNAWAVGSGGFEVATQSAKSLGRGTAFVADADDPSAVGYNPAGMSQLDGVQVSGGFSGVNLITRYYAAPGGVNTRSASKLSLIPNMYATLKIPFVPAHFGFGSYVPFGLGNHYSSTHPFRYVGYKNEFQVIAYSLSGSIKLMPSLSVGASAVYYDSHLSQRAKYNSTRITQGVIPGFPAQPDGLLRLDMDGHAWGWNIGGLWKFHKKHQIGFFYRSNIRMRLTGRLASENLQGPVMRGIFGGSDVVSRADSDIVLPQQLTLGYKFQITPKWDVETDFAWTGWRSFDHQVFNNDPSNAVLAGLSPIPRGYHDTFSFSVGSDWAINKYVTLRGGYFFFQAPGRSGNAGPVIPDAHRNGFAVGLGLNPIKNLTIDLTYLAELFTDRNVDYTNVGKNVGIVAEGKYQSFINVFAVNVTYRFGLGAEEEEEEEKEEKGDA